MPATAYLKIPAWEFVFLAIPTKPTSNKLSFRIWNRNAENGNKKRKGKMMFKIFSPTEVIEKFKEIYPTKELPNHEKLALCGNKWHAMVHGRENYLGFFCYASEKLSQALEQYGISFRTILIYT